jgi:hypothetical protein
MIAEMVGRILRPTKLQVIREWLGMATMFIYKLMAL